nr:MAG TPA: hypothetical protein [Caudoviricetes sp.]
MILSHLKRVYCATAPGLLNRYQDPRPGNRSGVLRITRGSQAEALDRLPEVLGGHDLVEALTAQGDRFAARLEGLVPGEALVDQLLDVRVNVKADSVTHHTPGVLQAGEAGGLAGQLDNLGQLGGGVDGLHWGLLH